MHPCMHVAGLTRLEGVDSFVPEREGFRTAFPAPTCIECQHDFATAGNLCVCAKRPNVRS